VHPEEEKDERVVYEAACAILRGCAELEDHEYSFQESGWKPGTARINPDPVLYFADGQNVEKKMAITADHVKYNCKERNGAQA